MPQRLHAGHVYRRLGEGSFRTAHLVQHFSKRRLGVKIYPPHRHGRIIAQRRARLALGSRHAHMERVGAFLPIGVREAIEIVFHHAVIKAVGHLQLAVREVVQRRTAKEADGIRGTVRSQRRRHLPQLVIHTAEAQTQRCPAVADERFVIDVIIVHIVIGEQRADAQLIAPPFHIVQRLLNPVAVTPRRRAAIIFHVQHGIGNFSLFNANLQIARPELAARAENAHRFRSGKAADPV